MSLTPFVAIGVIIHLTVFWLIVGKAVVNTQFRIDVIRMPVWVILLIGFLWPLTIVAIIIFVLYLITKHRGPQ